MSLKKRLYKSPRTKRIASWAVVGSVIWIPFPPEVVIPGLYALTGSKLIGCLAMFSQSVFYTFYYTYCVRILLFEDRTFFRTHWIGRSLTRAIKKIRSLARIRKSEHWSKELIRMLVTFGLALAPGTLTLALIFPLFLPFPRYYLICIAGIIIRILIVGGLADELLALLNAIF